MVTHQNSSSLLRPRISKSCDQCKARKVRCICMLINPGIIDPFTNLLLCQTIQILRVRRDAQCHFSETKRKLRHSEQGASQGQGALHQTGVITTPSTTAGSEETGSLGRRHRKLYVDHLLENPRVGGRQSQSGSLFKAHEKYESRIRSLSDRLGNDRLREIVEGIDTAINSRIDPSNKSSSWINQFRRPSSPVHLSRKSVLLYIQAYFEHVHIMYPFLDRNDFEQKAFRPDLLHYLEACPPFSALYHTVLALGCQYIEGGSYDPGNGKEWRLFQVSLGLFLDILVPRETLVNVQAVTAMTIFAMNLSCIQIGETLMSEAARMAQSLGYHKALYTEGCETACQRTFWVIYSLEKVSNFFIGKGSTFSDSDIGCPMPEMPLPEFGGFDWLLSFARFGRLISKAYDLLFCVTATMNSTGQYFEAIDEVNDDLENWRKTYPEELRPGGPFRPQNFYNSVFMLMSLRWHYYYYGVVMSLCRLTLHIGANTQSQRLEDAKFRLMNTAREVIDLTRFVDAEPYTSIWMLGIIPLSALFILFDFVIHNPLNPETNTNLALLGVAVGHFSRLDYATGGSLPCSMVSDFAHLAQQHVRDARSKSAKAAITNPTAYRSYGNDDTNHNINNISSNSHQVETGLRTGIPGDVGYYPGQVQNGQVPIMNQLNNGFDGNSDSCNGNNDNGNGVIPFTENLLYPVTEFPAPMYGEMLAGFDISNLFDFSIPDANNPLQ